MRGLVVAVGACAGAATPVAPRAMPKRIHVEERPAVDVIAELSGDPPLVSWLLPGPIELALGATAIAGTDQIDPITVVLIEDRGSHVQVGIRLDHVRVGAWIERGW